MGAGQRFDHLADFRSAHSFDKHFPHRTVQFLSATMITLEDLRLMTCTRARNREISNRPSGRFQIPRVMTVVVICSLLAAFIGFGSNESRHFFLQNLNECEADCLPHPLLDELLESFLTCAYNFAIVAHVSHWYPPGSFS